MDYAAGTATASSMLAATGGALVTGSYVLLAVGLVFAGVTTYLLARKNKDVRP